jgi:hypothetical protein
MSAVQVPCVNGAMHRAGMRWGDDEPRDVRQESGLVSRLRIGRGRRRIERMVVQGRERVCVQRRKSTTFRGKLGSSGGAPITEQPRWKIRRMMQERETNKPCGVYGTTVGTQLLGTSSTWRLQLLIWSHPPRLYTLSGVHAPCPSQFGLDSDPLLP